MKSRLLGAVCAYLAVVSFDVNAVIVSVDWKTAGDNLITRDTDSGLEWLDLTVTTNRSYNDIRSELGLGGEFEGWQYASSSQVRTFFNAFGGNSDYNGWSTENNGLFDLIAPYWGDLFCQNNGCNAGEGSSTFQLGDIYNIALGDYWQGSINDYAGNDKSLTQDYVKVHHQISSGNTSSLGLGSALVRYNNPVPIPPALYLFGAGLIGLVGVARKKAG